MRNCLTNQGKSGTINNRTIVHVQEKVKRFAERVDKLNDGRYILTLTLNEQKVCWTIQQMNEVEK